MAEDTKDDDIRSVTRFYRVPKDPKVTDCVAHRCHRHRHIDQVMQEDVDGPPENVIECSYCVVDRVIKTLVAETIFPLVAAFEAAEGQLRLLGVQNGARTAALFKLLEALTEKAAENDFEVIAQQVIQGTLVADGPKDPQ